MEDPTPLLNQVCGVAPREKQTLITMLYKQEPTPSTPGELITADHKILNLDDESRMITGTFSSYDTDTSIGYRVILRKVDTHKKQHLV